MDDSLKDLGWLLLGTQEASWISTLANQACEAPVASKTASPRCIIYDPAVYGDPRLPRASCKHNFSAVLRPRRKRFTLGFLSTKGFTSVASRHKGQLPFRFLCLVSILICLSLSVAKWEYKFYLNSTLSLVEEKWLCLPKSTYLFLFATLSVILICF